MSFQGDTGLVLAKQGQACPKFHLGLLHLSPSVGETLKTRAVVCHHVHCSRHWGTLISCEGEPQTIHLSCSLEVLVCMMLLPLILPER